jgi:hypothetical protein
MPVSEMLGRISARELAEWAEYYRLEPFGQEWHQAAMAPMVLANLFRGEDAPAHRLEEFIPGGGAPDDDDDDEMPWEQRIAAIAAINAQLGGEDRRGITDGNTDDIVRLVGDG